MYLGKNSYDSNSVFLEHLVKCNLKKIKPEYNYLQIHFFFYLYSVKYSTKARNVLFKPFRFEIDACNMFLNRLI